MNLIQTMLSADIIGSIVLIGAAVIGAAGGIVAAAKHVAGLTKTKKDDEVLDRIEAAINAAHDALEHVRAERERVLDELSQDNG